MTFYVRLLCETPCFYDLLLDLKVTEVIIIHGLTSYFLSILSFFPVLFPRNLEIKIYSYNRKKILRIKDGKFFFFQFF